MNILYTLLPFSDISEEELALKAKQVIPPNAPPRVIRHPLRRKAYLAGRAAIAILTEQMGLSAWVVADPEFGYLSLKSSGTQSIQAYVNISHTDGIAAAALSEFPVGIDIELKSRDTHRVLHRISTEEERKEADPLILEEIPSGIALWSGKEAFSKALGLGIRFGLSDFRLYLSGTPPFRVATSRQGIFSLESPCIHYECYGSYVIALCSERRAIEEGVRLTI